MACQIEYVQLDVASGESIEKLAREARYRVLAPHVNAQTLLLLGQHADDQLETFLLALKRGSGPKGWPQWLLMPRLPRDICSALY